MTKNTNKTQENTTMNINRIEENNDREHQQCLGKQQPYTPIKSKENTTMNTNRIEENNDHEHQQCPGKQQP
jgi:hypothetical protein